MKKKILFILLIGVVSLISIQCSKEKKEAEAQKSDKGLISNIKDGFKKRKHAKNQKNYEVNSSFAYGTSTDEGIAYSQKRKEFKVGETVYMMLSIEVKEKKKDVGIGGTILGFIARAVGGVVFFVKKTDLDFVSGELVIPNITSVDARYLDGTKITPFTDEKSGATTFPFQIPISLEEKEQKDFLIFQFIAKKESEISVDLKFDDNIAEKYNKIETIKFVK